MKAIATSFSLEGRPLAVSVNDTARLLSCGRTQVYKLASNGALLKVKIGRSTRITLASIHALLTKEG